jgi:hypothetical protein
MKTAKIFIAAGLMWLLGWSVYGHCEGPPELPFNWEASHEAHFSQKTSDGGYIIAGQFWTPGGNQYDFWVLKLDKNGSIVWQKTYGGGDWDIGFATEPTSDGGYIVAGSTESFGAGDEDVWVLKLNAQGGIVWQKTYGGEKADYAWAIRQTKDGGYVVAGTTASFGEGSFDIWVLKLSQDGTVIWDKTYGGKGEESDYFRHIPIEQTSDGGFIVAGSTRSFGAGDEDFWIFKLSAEGTIIWQKTYGTSLEEYPTSVREMPSGGYRVTGTSALGIDKDEWVLMLDSRGNMSGFTSSGNRTMTMYDTSVMPKAAAERTGSSAASVGDTSLEMEKQKEPKGTAYN